ncbi:MAG: hypothetical protein JKY37_20860 [Nannocystaceae bacterium]|nr:hypothetical protein [Nannocystaceae bacterium]
MIASASLSGLWLAVGGGYVLVGAIVALRLASRQASRAAALAAVACWPLMLPLLSSPSSAAPSGPLAARIEQCARELRATMADPAAADVPVVDDLDDLVRDLQQADERLGMVDALVADVGGASPAVAGLEALRGARARAAAEVEAVLDGMVELRLSIGLRSLAGNAVPVQDRLVDLRARLGALDEIAQFDHPRQS